MPYNLTKIFKDIYNEIDSTINTEEGYPVYDTMINPNSKAFDAIDAELNNLEQDVDYSNFFDSDGNIISEDKFNIISNNLLLGDGIASKGRVNLIFEFSSLQDTVVISSGLTVKRDSYIFVVPSGSYQLPVYGIRSGKIQYLIPAVSQEIGSDVPALSAGAWELETGSLPTGCLRVFSVTTSASGISNAGNLTVDNIKLLMSNSALNTRNSILNAVNNASKDAGVIPDKLTVCSYVDDEYQSGVVPFQDEDEDVRVFRFGGYTDVRAHSGVEIQEVYLENGELYGDGLYRYYLALPVYAVISCKTWVTGSLAIEIPFTFNYVDGYIVCREPKVRVSVLTTSNSVWSFLKSTVSSLVSSSGTVKLLPFYGVRFYADTDSLTVDDVGSLADVNTALTAYFEDGGSIETLSFSTLQNAIFQATGITVQNFKYFLPDSSPTDTPFSFSSGTFPTTNIDYGPENLTVELPLTDKNTVCAGGYSGLYTI